MRRPKGANWKQLGSVGVDSGMLMVCDPCYIDGHWITGTEPQGHPKVMLTQKGLKKFPENKDWSWQFSFGGAKYDDPQEALGGLSVNVAREQGLVFDVPQPVINEFSYRGVCSITSSDGSGAVDMTATVFRSGYGDGLYEVWGRVNADGRIVEVRILMD